MLYSRSEHHVEATRDDVSIVTGAQQGLIDYAIYSQVRSLLLVPFQKLHAALISRM